MYKSRKFNFQFELLTCCTLDNSDNKIEKFNWKHLFRHQILKNNAPRFRSKIKEKEKNFDSSKRQRQKGNEI